jgi:hypothetical protein
VKIEETIEKCVGPKGHQRDINWNSEIEIGGGKGRKKETNVSRRLGLPLQHLMSQCQLWRSKVKVGGMSR